MKVANSFSSVIRGVSEQVPHARADGQHTEQVNMISSPGEGLVRRHGSQWQGELLLPGVAPSSLPAIQLDTDAWASMDFTYNQADYLLMYRRGARPVGSWTQPFQVYDKTNKVFIPVAQASTDTQAALLAENGISAVAPVGRYLFMAGNNIPVTGSTSTLWASAENSKYTAVWIRGGAYSRTFKITIKKTDGTSVVVSHTTPSASYQGTLSTSDIPATASDYVKQVNDRVNAYNAAVTAWIGQAAAQIQPATIAQFLNGALASAGVFVSLTGSTLCFSMTGVETIEADDGGDGSLIRAVGNTIESVDKTSIAHYPGKIVRVQGKTSAEAFYLKAIPKDKNALTLFTEVTWVETAGVVSSITSGLFYATVHNGTFYYASSATALAALVPGEHPTFASSVAGDLDTSPPPNFSGRQITYLGAFQNRLLVGSGGVLSVSKSGDYLNFFRSTVLTIPADDPFDLSPQAGENDEFKHSVMYDQDLVIFGDKRQYVLPGRAALAPTSAQMPVMSNYEGVADSPPVAAGGYIFYAKRGAVATSMHQIQPGKTNNSPESFPTSSQLDTYLAGNAIDTVVRTGSPSTLFLRATGDRSSVYTFAYLDRQDGRALDAWSRWTFNAKLGPVIGMSSTKDGLIVAHARANDVTGQMFLVADLVPNEVATSTLPYLDSVRPEAALLTANHSVSATSDWVAAFPASSKHAFDGGKLASKVELAATYPDGGPMWVGVDQEAYFIPTNPYVKDSKDRSILTGRTTVTMLTVAFKDSLGFTYTVKPKDNQEGMISVSYSGRLTGYPTHVVGKEPLTTGQKAIPIGRETRSYTLKVAARRWYPLTVTAMEWVGQIFNRTQRV